MIEETDHCNVLFKTLGKHKQFMNTNGKGHSFCYIEVNSGNVVATLIHTKSENWPMTTWCTFGFE